MWLRLLVIFLLFSLLAILQTSFLTHFSIMGTSLNLIFILFYLVVFFESSQKYIQGIFSAIMAGFFLDTLSLLYFGVSFIYLLIIVFILKYILYLLHKKKGEYQLIHFATLFVISFIIYNLLHLMIFFSWIFLIEIIYNLFFAILGFYIYKKF